MKRRSRRAGSGGGSIIGGGGRHSTTSSITGGTPQPTPRKTVDLNSRSETTVANIVFLPVKQHTFPIVQFECFDCLVTGEHIHEWLQATGLLDIRDLLRLEDQELNRIGPLTKGVLTLLEGAATLEGNLSIPISILALHLPNNTRFHFFWTPLSPSSLLTELTSLALIGPPRVCTDKQPHCSPSGAVFPPRHHALYTLLKHNFLMATTYPDAPIFRAASLISDMCPTIRNLSEAHRRIEAADHLHPSRDSEGDGKDLGDDRYIFELEPAERALASFVYVCCSDYLIIKRNYFKAFSRECVTYSHKIRRTAARPAARGGFAGTADDGDDGAAENDDTNQTSDEDEDNENTSREEAVIKTPTNRNDTPTSVDTPIALTTRSHRPTTAPSAATPSPATARTPRYTAARIGAQSRAERVRTVNAHIKSVEAATGWTFSRSRRLIAGWEMLGFLDEMRVLDVAEGREGESEDEDGDEGG